MLRIGIEINHVMRNLNRQLIKYYQKDIDPTLDDTEIDIRNEDVLNKYIKFKNKKAKNQFLTVDYAYEIFGCAKTSDNRLTEHFVQWQYDVTNYDKDDVEIILFSMNEAELTIQSTLFFLSKIGTRVRKVLFPRSIKEVEDECDVIIAASNEVLDKVDGERNVLVCVERGFNEGHRDKARLSYLTMTDIIDDKAFLDKVYYQFYELNPQNKKENILSKGTKKIKRLFKG